MKLNEEQLAVIVRKIIKEQLSPSKATQVSAFNLVEDLKGCLRNKNWEGCIELCDLIKSHAMKQVKQ